MSKNIHLICNAHLDPVWQWEWEEGAAETLSTYRIAADFCEQYEKFVFCHNEALLYRWIEEYDMPLFERIKKLVAAGKWHIMGGWHLQPDCNMPSGEAMVRQIHEGRKYFKEKFGVVPKVGINVDPFGHSRGLVQIMVKCGYEGYLFMRPYASFKALPANEFTWEGYDGSEIIGIRTGAYNSAKGKAVEKISHYVEKCPEDDCVVCLWGIGNHGGGPSKEDLDAIVALRKEVGEGVNIIDSTPEGYLEAIKGKRAFPKVDSSLNLWAPGCYTSQVRVKQKYRQAENTYFFTESICAHAAEQGLMEYPSEDFAKAIYDILTIQFHDILPGSSIQAAEEMGIRMADHALEILSRLKARAFFALASGQRKPDSDKIPMFVYNPHPYPLKGDFTCEFMLWDQNWNHEYLQPVVYDDQGNRCPAQGEKENSTIPLEWRKRVLFHTTLAPMSLNRFDCAFDTIEKKPGCSLPVEGDHLVYDKGGMKVKINRKTGLVDELKKDGKDYLAKGAFGLEIFKDDFDPWYMNAEGWYEKTGDFQLLSPEQVQEFCALDAPIDGVHVIEGGDVRTVVEAIFGYKTSRAVVKYILSEKEGLQVDIRINWNEKQELVRWNIPAAFAAESCIGEHLYGREELFHEMKENVAQKYVAICDDQQAIQVSNIGTYGSAFDDKSASLKMTLLRSASYCAHPVGDRKVMPQDRYMPYIEQGERDFSFKLTFGAKEEILDHAGRVAHQFNQPAMAFSFYPTGTGEKPKASLLMDSDVITCNAFKKAEDGEGFILRLFNPTEKEQEASIEWKGEKTKVSFGKYEIKTLRLNESGVTETDLLEGLLD